LGGCFGAGCLVSYGTDLVGDAYDGNNKGVPDPDPMDCGGHGTHVAGSIAAQSNPFDFTGASPGVQLGAYKVFGCDGQVSNDVLIAAYNMAYEAGSDIITASIGGPAGWSEEPWAVAVQRIVEHGVPCTVAAGNEGAVGLFYASTAANGKKVTAVASVDNTKTPALPKHPSVGLQVPRLSGAVSTCRCGPSATTRRIRPTAAAPTRMTRQT
jgi:subtilisin family serine protease